MSYRDKLDRALTLIREYNEAINPDAPTLNPEDFEARLKATGAFKEELLSSLSYEDILTCFASPINRPTILAKEIAKIFRGKDQKEVLLNENEGPRPVPAKKAERMTPRELVEALDPEEATSPVAKRLKEMSQGKAFLVFSTGRQVDVNTTTRLLLEVKAGYPARNDMEVNGVLKKVYPLGELPENFAEENPLYHNRPLRPDGTCDQTGRSWEGVPLAVRQVVYLAVKNGDIDVNAKNGLQAANAVINMALAPDAEKLVRQTYRQSAIKFDELNQTGGLPTLKIALGQKAGGPNRPFDDGKKVVWAEQPKANRNSWHHQ